MTAGRRELEEETGFVSDDWEYLGWGYANWGNQSNRVHHLVARGCRPDGQADALDAQEIRVRLSPLSTVMRPGYVRESSQQSAMFCYLLNHGL